MSYWSHNPEKYDEICNKGIADYLFNQLGIDLDSFEDPVEISLITQDIVAFLQENYQETWDKLLLKAQKEVRESEQTYWEGFIP